MDIWSSLGGRITLELTTADPAGLMQSAAEQGIVLYQVEFVATLTFRCAVRRKDYRSLRKLTEKRGDVLKIYGRDGLYWDLCAVIRRPVLLAGCALLFLLVLLLPTRVLFVQVEGNQTVPARRILAAAEESGIRFWASRREVRSERVKNDLLGLLPQLEWAGVNTKGCVAVISVKEKISEKTEQVPNFVSSIVAVRDGIVESCTAWEGNLLCHVGQAVREGEVLISGYTDCGICIRATGAEGEIFARTRQKTQVMTLSQRLLRGNQVAVKHKYSLLVGKKRINLWKDSGIWEGSCDRMYEEYYITLPGGFSLPVAFVQETCVFYETEWTEVDAASLQENLKQAAKGYLTEQMIAGKILKGSEMFRFWQDTCRMEGVYLCSEMIGRVQREKIGE